MYGSKGRRCKSKLTSTSIWPANLVAGALLLGTAGAPACPPVCVRSEHLANRCAGKEQATPNALRFA